MITRSKNEVFKPKVYATVLDDYEPLTIKEAFLSPEWTKAACLLMLVVLSKMSMSIEVSLEPFNML